jgi:hypothetical protein
MFLQRYAGTVDNVASTFRRRCAATLNRRRGDNVTSLTLWEGYSVDSQKRNINVRNNVAIVRF